MKKFLFLLFSCFFLWWFCSADLAWFTIQSYTSEYNLQNDGTLKVKEIIDVSFYEYRHGIYRDIPYKYSNNLSTPIKNVKVQWENFTTSKVWSNFQIKIWNKNKTIIWDHEYIIEYDIKRTVRTFSWWQELYRNLLWLEWNTPVNNYYFKLQLPNDVKISDEDFYVVYWPEWSQMGLDAHIENNSIIIDRPINIWANQAVTIWIRFPLNTFEPPTVDKISTFIFWTPNWLYETKFWKIIKLFILIMKGLLELIFSIFLIILVIFSLIASNSKIVLEPKHLRMKRKNLKDVIHYTPPKWYSPIEVNLLYNRYPSTQVITTALYTWVTEGYMEVNVQKKFFWLGKNVSFETIKEKENFWGYERTGFRNDLEEELWKCIKTVNYNNCISNHNIDKVKNIANRMFISLRHELIPEIYRKYENTKQTKISLWFLLFWCVFWVLFVLMDDTHTTIKYKMIAFGFYLLWSIFRLFLWYLSYYLKGWREYKKNNDEFFLTSEWKDILEQIHWFRKYLLYVDNERLNKLLKDDPKYCEKMLPYAIALWIWSRWIKKCRWFSDKFNIETIPSEITASNWGFIESIMASWAIVEITQSSSGWGWDWWSDSWFDSGWSSSGSSWWGGGWGWWWSW